MGEIIAALYVLKDMIVVGNDKSIDVLNKIVEACENLVIPDPVMGQEDFCATELKAPGVHVEYMTVNIYPPTPGQ